MKTSTLLVLILLCTTITVASSGHLFVYDGLSKHKYLKKKLWKYLLLSKFSKFKGLKGLKGHHIKKLVVVPIPLILSLGAHKGVGFSHGFKHVGYKTKLGTFGGKFYHTFGYPGVGGVGGIAGQIW